MIPFVLVHLTEDLSPMCSLFFFSFLTETDRETIEELNIALRNERTRAEQIQQAFTNEKRQTEALKHVKEQADQLRSINKGYLLKGHVQVARRTGSRLCQSALWECF